MTTKYIMSFFAVATVSSLALMGTMLITADKLHRQGTRQESQGRAMPADDELLTRYYNQGASAGSTWENLIDGERN